MAKDNEQQNTYNEEKNYKPSIEEFICDEFSICREERQYAVFLYNILRRYGSSNDRKVNIQRIFSACGLEDTAVIDHVFYEAAFMRDFYERDRRLRYSEEKEWKTKLLNKRFTARKNVSDKDGFNEELMRFVCEQMCKEFDKNGKIKVERFSEVRNLGQNEIEFDKISIGGERLELETEKQWIIDRVNWMMNAKPDIAVIYHNKKEENEKEEKELLFIECKFLSRESSYKADYGKQGNVKQTEVQWLVADFLCNYLNKNSSNETEKIKPSSVMKENKSHFVKFVRKVWEDERKIAEKKGQENETEKKGEILISDLIEIEKDIFK